MDYLYISLNGRKWVDFARRQKCKFIITLKVNLTANLKILKWFSFRVKELSETLNLEKKYVG